MADVWQLYKSLKLYILSNFALLKNPRLPLHYDDPLKRVQNVVFAVEHQGGVEICGVWVFSYDYEQLSRSKEIDWIQRVIDLILYVLISKPFF